MSSSLKQLIEAAKPEEFQEAAKAVVGRLSQAELATLIKDSPLVAELKSQSYEQGKAQGLTEGQGREQQVQDLLGKLPDNVRSAKEATYRKMSLENMKELVELDLKTQVMSKAGDAVGTNSTDDLSHESDPKQEAADAVKMLVEGAAKRKANV